MTTPADLLAFRSDVRNWLEANGERLEGFRQRPAASKEHAFAHGTDLQRILAGAGWTLHGWPERFGGLGGPVDRRAVLYDELAQAGYLIPEAFLVVETLGPALCRFAPALAAVEVPQLVRGERLWCQGFSEPGVGSDLASLRTRATEDGENFRLTGQKIWVSFGQIAQATACLVRTGDQDSRHRGLSMLFVDFERPGVTVRPIRSAAGKNEFSEIFFDDVLVPRSCLIGRPGQGWEVAMHLLQWERGMVGWIRQAWLHSRLREALRDVQGTPVPKGSSTASDIGDAYISLLSLRAKTRHTVHRLSEGEFLGPEISVDKLLLSNAERSVLDTCRSVLTPAFQFGDTATEQTWRDDWFFSRTASIHGGSAEIQHDIVAERLLKLKRSR